MYAKLFRSLLLILGICGFIHASENYKFAVGFDKGISLRYMFPNGSTIGLIGRPSCADPYSCDNSTFYKSGKYTDMESYQSYTTYRSTEVRSKGVGVLLELTHSIDLNSGFNFSPYLNMGGEYGEYVYSNSYTTVYNNSSYYYNTVNSSNNTTNNYSYTKAIAEIGIMPGYTYKRLSIQFKIGIGGEMTIQEPEPGETGSDSKSKRAFLKYPYYDIVNSISLHLALF